LLILFTHQKRLRYCVLQVFDFRLCLVLIERRQGLRVVVLVVEQMACLERLFLQTKDVFAWVDEGGGHSTAIIIVIHYFIN
jgi:hypothetical protein